MNGKKTTVVLIVSALALIALDRLTKFLIAANIKLNDTVSVLKVGGTDLINFTRCENNGAAFSILSGRQGFLIAVSSIFIIVAIIVLFSGKLKSKLMLWATTLIIAGGTGNLIDRIATGKVTDFIDLRFTALFMKNGFAIFNFADICAVTGAFMLLFAVIRDEARDYKARKACSVEEDD